MEGLSALNIATVTVIACVLAASVAATVYQWFRRDSIDDLLHRVRKHNR